MATAGDMITRALRTCRALGSDQTPTGQESEEARLVLNSMLDSWATERRFCYAIRDESFTWAASAASKTVGAAGDFATDRPVQVDESSYFTVNSIDYPLRFINGDAYSAKAVKTVSNSFPEMMYVEYTSSALVTLYAYPVPSASITFHLRTWRLLQSFAALTTTFALPPGYQKAIELSLAEEIAPEYGVAVSPELAIRAARARSRVKRINSPAPVMATEVGYMTGSRRTGYIYGDITG